MLWLGAGSWLLVVVFGSEKPEHIQGDEAALALDPIKYRRPPVPVFSSIQASMFDSSSNSWGSLSIIRHQTLPFKNASTTILNFDFKWSSCYTHSSSFFLQDINFQKRSQIRASRAQKEDSRFRRKFRWVAAVCSPSGRIQTFSMPTTTPQGSLIPPFRQSVA
ncbi:hypothetical protein CPB83DRAFT_609825 [Crepidotus variabilis]|uniref:Uncharacterized protein n=1 Tax=Crepidotus variabilis TaxID=179855 RepID=A0A9P6E8Z1_9AGAR|nr:hypothetical protein CPB83DRAFT_609825 [Crepidotus variabilis]